MGSSKFSPEKKVALALFDEYLQDGLLTASEPVIIKQPQALDLLHQQGKLGHGTVGYVKGQARIHTALALALGIRELSLEAEKA